MYELVEVRASFYGPGISCTYERLLELDKKVWHFDDPAVNCVWDLLDNPEIEEGRAQFVKSGICFDFRAIVQPCIYHPQGSILGCEIELRGVEELWGPGMIDYDQIVEIAKRHRERDPDFAWANFVLVFDVHEFTIYHEDGSDVEFELLGELDFIKLSQIVVQA